MSTSSPPLCGQTPSPVVVVTCRTTTCYVCVSHYFVIHLFSFPLCTLCYCLFATYFHTYTNRRETIVTSFFIIALGESNPSAVFELFQFLLTILMDIFATVENQSKLANWKSYHIVIIAIEQIPKRLEAHTNFTKRPNNLQEFSMPFFIFLIFKHLQIVARIKKVIALPTVFCLLI